MKTINRIAFIICLVATVSCKEKEKIVLKCVFDVADVDYSRLIGSWQLKFYSDGGINHETDISCGSAPADVWKYMASYLDITQGDYMNVKASFCDGDRQLIAVPKKASDVPFEILTVYYNEECEQDSWFYYTYDDSFGGLIIMYELSDKTLTFVYKRK
ncbi:MAG TPA: hypothetical protein VIU12_14055 [Chryseolinea sp.]